MLHWVRTVNVTLSLIEFKEGNGRKSAVINSIPVREGLFDELKDIRKQWESGNMSSLDLFAALGPFKHPQPTRKMSFRRERDDVGGGYGRSDY